MLTKQEELKDRVEQKRHELQARLAELKADTRHEAIAAKEKISRSLSDLETYLKEGWEKVEDAVTSKLNEWLDRN